jgi:TRAP-type uncharacterized transport system fused permease subunit
MIGFLGGFIGIALLGMAVYFGLGWIKDVIPDYAFLIVTLGCAAAYIYLVWIASKSPDLVVDPPDAPITELPRAGDVAVTGLYYLLPIVILIWSIVVERLSPALSAFWATIAMIIVILTQDALKAFFRGTGNYKAAFNTGVGHWFEGMIAGSRNMISIAVATGAAGIIVGTISLTGAHQVVGEFVEFLSGGSLIAMLLLVAVMSLILGMGLPTTANYIVVSSLMAPVILTLGAQNGLIVPLIAVHMFVFYFGILADDTPPVGLAAFAAAAISGGDPIKTGLQGFAYDIRTALLPFLFIFNTELLLIDVSVAKAFFVFGIAVIAMMLFASATQGYLFVRNKIWESALLLVVAFALFRPAFFLDFFVPPFETHPATEIMNVVDDTPPKHDIMLIVSGPDFDTGEVATTTILVPLAAGADAATRLSDAGLTINVGDGKAVIEEPFPGTPYFETLGKAFDYYGDEPVQVAEVRMEAKRIFKEIIYIPAILVLGLVVFLQKRRQREQQGGTAEATA